MNKKEPVLSLISKQGLLPLYYNDSAEVSAKLLQALYAGGVRLLEYTNRGQHALQNFELLRKLVDREMKDLQLGVGTIKSNDDAKRFISAGADFVVCPIVNPEVAATVHAHELLWIPGCFTNTEIYTAEVAGASLVKIFPGNIGGPGYISALKEIFGNLDFMPTGGVEATKENIDGWIKAGVYAVGMGSKLVSKSVMEQQQYDELTKSAAHALSLIAGSRAAGK
jgi:2-dehydro-3-deoxyphosphogluconate aldolase/(4S)-4-hydroxy-2-oxoglutarate aldolase